MTNVIGFELAVGKVPNLNIVIPATGHDQWSGRVRGEADAGNPTIVAVVLNGVLAFTKNVPELDSFVTGSGNNLTVVSGESDGKNVLGVSDEATSAATTVNFPKAEGVIPRARESKLTVRRNDDVRDEVRVTFQSTTSETEAAVFASEFPNNDRFVTGSRENNIRSLRSSGDLSNPASVAFEVTAVRKNFRHGGGLSWQNK
jgi:hypothetical protein